MLKIKREKKKKKAIELGIILVEIRFFNDKGMSKEVFAFWDAFCCGFLRLRGMVGLMRGGG